MSRLADQPISIKAPLADVAKRFFAALIDGALLGAVSVIVLVILYDVRTTFAIHAAAVELWAAAFAVLLGWLYCAGLESASGRATLGKRALGLKVVDRAGRRVSFLRATGRHFAKFLSALPCFV